MNGFERRKERKKRDILEAALALFTEHGVEKPTIAEIAAKANVSQVTIYNYFGSKRGLTQEALLHYMERSIGQFEQIVKSGLPFRQKIEHVIFMKKDASARIHKELYEHFMREYASGPDAMRRLFKEKALPLYLELFREGRERGEIDGRISDEALLLFIEAMSEYIGREDVYQRVLPYAEEMMHLMFHGILGRREPT